MYKLLNELKFHPENFFLVFIFFLKVFYFSCRRLSRKLTFPLNIHIIAEMRLSLSLHPTSFPLPRIEISYKLKRFTVEKFHLKWRKKMGWPVI